MCPHIKSTLQFIQLSLNVSFSITSRKTENMFNMMSEFCLIDNKITSVTPRQHNIMNMFQSFIWRKTNYQRAALIYHTIIILTQSYLMFVLMKLTISLSNQYKTIGYNLYSNNLESLLRAQLWSGTSKTLHKVEKISVTLTWISEAEKRHWSEEMMSLMPVKHYMVTMKRRHQRVYKINVSIHLFFHDNLVHKMLVVTNLMSISSLLKPRYA